MRSLSYLLTALFGIILSVMPAKAVGITLSCGTIGSQYNDCQQSVDRWERLTGHTVRLVQVPQKTNDQLNFFRRALAQPDTGPQIDVVKIDSIWVNFVEQYLLDLRPYSAGEENAHFAVLIENATFEEELKAMPLWSGVGLFYYRKDLLEKYGETVPRTWAEMEVTAKRIQAAERKSNTGFWGFVFEATAGEGLTCNALEWLQAMGGPPLLNDTGAISVNAPEAMQTLRRVKSWIGDIAPSEVTTMNNETARLFFQSGNALFMRNWPYAWAISQQSDSDLVGKVGVTTLLAGPQGPGAGTQGGWYLGVSRHSEHPEIAAHLLLFMTSQNEQLQRALFQSQNPTRPTLYSDPDIRSVSEFFQTVYGGLQSGLNRPNAPLRSSYVHVSNAWSDALNIYLSQNQDDPVPLFNDLQVYLERLERRDW